MSTNAGTLGASNRQALITFWAVVVSILAAAALILSAMALSVAARDDEPIVGVGAGTADAAAIASWDVGKLDAMEDRVFAATVQVPAITPVWDAAKLQAMDGRAIAATVAGASSTTMWDAAKREAMGGRMLAG